MPLSTKLIAYIIAGFAVLGAGLYGIYEGTDLLKRPEVAEEAAPAVPDAQDETDTAAPGTAIAPSFDLVRVEPSGEIVAAGQSSPTARVELVLTDGVLAEAVANAGGEWALVSDRTLDPGTYDLLVRATGPDGEGDMVEGDRVTVVIEGPDRTPLVAVTPPDEPTRVVQQPDPGEEQVAEAEAPAESAPEPSAETPAAAAGTDVAEAPAAAPDETGQESDTAMAPSTADSVSAGEAAEAPVAATGGGETPPAAGGETASASGEEPATDEAGAEAEPSAAPGTVTAAAPADEPAPRPEAPDVATGREAPGQDEIGQQADAATGSRPDDGSDAEVAAAPTEAPAPPAPSTQGGPDAQVSIETVEVEEPSTLMLSGRADEGASVRIYLNNERLADLQAGAGGRWGGSLQREIPPGRYEVRADLVDPQGEVVARAEVRFDRVQVALEEEAGEQAASEPSSDGSGITIVARGDQAGQVAFSGQPGASGQSSVILISRGDNLWRIARKIYGKGVRHTVIYEANKNQIRNPHRIYPGQVFTIPVLEDDEAGPNG